MHLTYLLILAACVLGTLPLEFVIGTRVYPRWRPLLAAVGPVAVLFSVWDVLAIRDHWWHYDTRYLVGVTLPGRLPIEELLFFVIIPVCAVLSYEAVGARRPEWVGRR